MKGELIINGKDAYTEWGVSFDETALSTLMTPPPIKALIENDSRLEDGKTMIVSKTTTNSDGKSTTISVVKVDSRDITISMNITASSKEEFLQRYWKFCQDVLEKGVLDISTSYLSGVVFHMIYQSCSQFSELRLGIGKFTLKLTEPNPKNRK